PVSTVTLTALAAHHLPCFSSSLSSFLFLLLRQPPSSTLFPYTTLFRSLPPSIVFSEFRNSPDWALLFPPRGRPASSVRGSTEQPDRKSTRLNSSHGSISYAVFCLKKKSRNQWLQNRIIAYTLSTRAAQR